MQQVAIFYGKRGKCKLLCFLPYCRAEDRKVSSNSEGVCSSMLYCMPGGWEVEVAIFIDFHHTVFASLKNYKFVGKKQ